MTAPAFDYSNLSDRPTGPVLRTLSALLPGVRRVQDQVAPWARAWEAHNRRVLAQDGPLWVALGDSMTQGIGASAPERGWAGQLSERLAGAGWQHRLVNLSVSGARVEDVLDRQLPALDAALAASGAADAALVTVVIGSNDIVAARHRDGLVERFAQMLDRLPPALGRRQPARTPGGRRALVDALLRERAADGRLVLADMREEGPRSWRGRLAADLFHPNDLGYADMATVVERALDRSGLTQDREATTPGPRRSADEAATGDTGARRRRTGQAVTPSRDRGPRARRRCGRRPRSDGTRCRDAP